MADLDVRSIVAQALGLEPAQLGEDAGMETVPEWDSFGHLNVLVALDKATQGRAKGIPGLAKATSLGKISSLLKENGLKP